VKIGQNQTTIQHIRERPLWTKARDKNNNINENTAYWETKTPRHANSLHCNNPTLSHKTHPQYTHHCHHNYIKNTLQNKIKVDQRIITKQEASE